MAIEIQGKVGPGSISSLGDGVLVDPYLGKQAQAVVQDFAPRYVEAGYRALAFCGSTQAGIAITNLATTATGLILINPLNSGRNIWIVDLVVAQSSAAGATQPNVALAANAAPVALASYTLTTSLTIQPTLIGGPGTPTAKLLSAATLPVAPVVIRSIWGQQNTATATGGPLPYIKDEIAGAVGIAPGCSVSLTATAAVSAISSITWIELPL
jgi:hypothetical protein